MRSPMILSTFALATAMASAQSFEGTYTARQSDYNIERTLRLDRNGRAELSTDVRSTYRPGREASDRFGGCIEEAHNRTVRHTGRWERTRFGVEIRLDSLNIPTFARQTSTLVFTTRGSQLICDRPDGFYGREPLVFMNNDRNWNDRDRDRDDRNDWGRDRSLLRVNRDLYRIRDIDLSDTRGRAKLTIETNNRTFKLFGDARQRGDEVTFVVDRGNGRYERDTYVLRVRNGRVTDIRGEGYFGRDRITFVADNGRRDRDFDRF